MTIEGVKYRQIHTYVIDWFSKSTIFKTCWLLIKHHLGCSNEEKYFWIIDWFLTVDLVYLIPPNVKFNVTPIYFKIYSVFFYKVIFFTEVKLLFHLKKHNPSLLKPHFWQNWVRGFCLHYSQFWFMHCVSKISIFNYLTTFLTQTLEFGLGPPMFKH
jgi:hypothetical protein